MRAKLVLTFSTLCLAAAAALAPIGAAHAHRGGTGGGPHLRG